MARLVDDPLLHARNSACVGVNDARVRMSAGNLSPFNRRCCSGPGWIAVLFVRRRVPVPNDILGIDWVNDLVDIPMEHDQWDAPGRLAKALCSAVLHGCEGEIGRAHV